jgi:hypothetical protein
MLQCFPDCRAATRGAYEPPAPEAPAPSVSGTAIPRGTPDELSSTPGTSLLPVPSLTARIVPLTGFRAKAKEVGVPSWLLISVGKLARGVALASSSRLHAPPGAAQPRTYRPAELTVSAVLNVPPCSL